MDDILLDGDQNGESNGGEQELISRPYQTQLEEVALLRNTIIHLPTGSGKTFIAVRVIKRLREDLKKPWNDGGKRTFFLVNTVPLVQQQKKVIERLCPVTVGGYSSEDGVDYWKKQNWDEELTKYQVVVMTSQILADMLTHSYIRIDNINLLIFDECHHAVIDHPMRLIMKQFETYPVEKHPRVLGLTATLLNSNVSVGKVADTLRLLETTFHATIATVDALGEVLSFSTNPIELVKYYEAPTLTSAALEAIEILEELKELVLSVELPRVNVADIKLEFWQRDISVDPKKIVKEVKNMLVSMVNFIEELGVFGGSLGVLAYIILLERLKRKAVTSEEEQLYKFTITRCTEARIILLSSMQKETGYEKIRKHSSPKVLELLNVLKEYSPQYYNRPEVILKVNQVKKPLCGIIFTQQRFTAKVLYNLLKEVKETNNEEFGFLQHDFIVGCNMNPMKCTREQFYVKKTCETALLKFTNKDLNLLISTSVIEEGIDIPQCSLILRYDPPQEYRSYIQSKGRARSKESRVVMLIQAENLQTFQKQYKSYQITENYIQEMLVGNTDFRDAPTQEEIQDELYEDDDIAPYISERGARLSAVSAASLLNRYCSALPHDKFTPITPMWIQEDLMDVQKGKVRLVKIFMPIACPVKEAISGMPMRSLKNAKRSAALNACKKLHQVGELEEITMLPKHQLPIDFEVPDIKECFLCWPWDEVEDPNVPKAGTKKQMRRHEKVFPKHLKWTGRSLPATFYLHIIKLEANFDPPTESREKALYNLLKRSEGYGFLTPQRLPTVCDFPMFLTIGEVSTSIEMNYAVIQLKEDSFELVKYFHFFLFDQVLQVAKNFVVYEGIENCMFFVPICKSGGQDYNIDWDVMQTYTIIPPVAEPASEERKNIKVKPEEYKDHVVTPWYRGNILPERYMVSNVLEYMTKMSPFDSTTPLYGTFADYYLNKYMVSNVLEYMTPLSPFDSTTPLYGTFADYYLNKYMVSNVLEYMTPLSPFDSTTPLCGTFADYYLNKYNLEVLGDKEQPLLEVRNISSRMNCLLPRAATIKSFTDKQRRLVCESQGDDKIKFFSEVFVPEFCNKYEFPGVLWYKAVLLPCIVHRLFMLLVAYELRAEIAIETNYGDPQLKQGFQWKPIEVDLAVTVKAMLSQIEDPVPVGAASIDRINDEESRPVRFLSMKDTIYQLHKQKISKEYPWDERNEPTDIDRHMSTVTVMDIECYDEFLSVVIPPQGKGDVTTVPPSRASPAASTSAAILPPPPKYNDKIGVLSQKMSPQGPELRDILAALTTIKSHDTFDLERVETLGDSFLKFAASLYLFHKFPALNEGQLTTIKCRFIGNRNLYYAGEKRKIGGRMKVEQFGPRKDFLVPGFFAPKEVQDFIHTCSVRPTFLIGINVSQAEALTGVLTEETLKLFKLRCSEEDSNVEKEPPGGAQPSMQGYVHSQAVADKSVADCVEALVGTYLLSGGITGAVKVLEWFKIMPPKDNFSCLLNKKVPTVLSLGKTNEAEILRLLNHSRDEIETILNYKFKDPAYLLEALSHASYIRNRFTPSYERLEFLGDAILDFLITAHIFENCRALKPGEISDLRSALVNNVTFAAYVVKLGLNKYICSQLNPTLEGVVMKFIEYQERRNHEILEDVLYLVDEEDCHLAEYVEVPKMLSDVFESIAGAIFLDSGGNLQTVWTVIYRIMWKEIESFARDVPIQPVRVLYENIHACPVFGKPKAPSPDKPKVMVPVYFTKNGQRETVYGCGGNKSQAKRAAAKLALRVLNS